MVLNELFIFSLLYFLFFLWAGLSVRFWRSGNFFKVTANGKFLLRKKTYVESILKHISPPSLRSLAILRSYNILLCVTRIWDKVFKISKRCLPQNILSSFLNILSTFTINLPLSNYFRLQDHYLYFFVFVDCVAKFAHKIYIQKIYTEAGFFYFQNSSWRQSEKIFQTKKILTPTPNTKGWLIWTGLVKEDCGEYEVSRNRHLWSLNF